MEFTETEWAAIWSDAAVRAARHDAHVMKLLPEAAMDFAVFREAMGGPEGMPVSVGTAADGGPLDAVFRSRKGGGVTFRAPEEWLRRRLESLRPRTGG